MRKNFVSVTASLLVGVLLLDSAKTIAVTGMPFPERPGLAASDALDRQALSASLSTAEFFSLLRPRRHIQLVAMLGHFGRSGPAPQAGGMARGDIVRGAI